MTKELSWKTAKRAAFLTAGSAAFLYAFATAASLGFLFTLPALLLDSASAGVASSTRHRNLILIAAVAVWVLLSPVAIVSHRLLIVESVRLLFILGSGVAVIALVINLGLAVRRGSFPAGQ